MVRSGPDFDLIIFQAVKKWYPYLFKVLKCFFFTKVTRLFSPCVTLCAIFPISAVTGIFFGSPDGFMTKNLRTPTFKKLS